MGLEIYLDPLSQPSRAIYIFAKKNGIPFQMHTVHILKGWIKPGTHLPLDHVSPSPIDGYSPTQCRPPGNALFGVALVQNPH